ESIEYLIEEKTNDGFIGGRINLIKGEQTSVSTYLEGLHIDPNSTEETVRFTVSAPDGTQGTIIVFRIDEGGVLSDLDNIHLAYDDVSIAEETDVAAFFDVQHSVDPAWLRVLTTSGLYVFVWIPHFSTHTITISSVVGAVEGLTVFLYIAVCVIAALVFITHGLSGPVIKFLMKRKTR
ncbi:MAG: hypothetical protein NT038_07745, partial [Euryarchaeota archaeon]|nr:hypothetical protein [Euryarchaeota archaeon]